MKQSICIVWPAQAVITESLFRHFSMMAEVAGYLKEYSNVIKATNIEVKIEDCATTPHTAMSMAKIVHENTIIALAINMNNVREAINTATFFKSIDKNKIIIAYGEAIACSSAFFSEQPVFDYIIDSGQFEIGLEYGICKILNLEPCTMLSYDVSCIALDGKVIKVSKQILLPEEYWGMPQLDLLPIADYLKIGNGELHITACKGCPFHCEFCNEAYVSTGCLRYRNKEEIVSYLTEIAPCNGATSVYLDSSTFTYNKKWVKSLCFDLISSSKPVLPWKTCTRLDCIDNELISLMGKAGCRRISIGVESVSPEIQKRNGKIIETEKIERFAKCCKENRITPRALLIIGLSGQTSKEIFEAEKLFSAYGIQTRFRVLQDFRFMLTNSSIKLSDFDRLNRWNVDSPFDDININEIRKLEYPEKRNQFNFS